MTVAAPVAPESKVITDILYLVVSLPIAVIMSPTTNFSPRVTSIEEPPIDDVPLVVVTVVAAKAAANSLLIKIVHLLLSH